MRTYLYCEAGFVEKPQWLPNCWVNVVCPDNDDFEFLNGEQEKQQTIDFIKFSREWIASTTIKGAPNYTTAINALVRFVGKEELDINLITLDFLEQFKAFLIGERDARTKKLMQLPHLFNNVCWNGSLTCSFLFRYLEVLKG